MVHGHVHTDAYLIHKVSRSGPPLVNGLSRLWRASEARRSTNTRPRATSARPCGPSGPNGPPAAREPHSRDMRAQHNGPEQSARKKGFGSVRKRLISTRARTASTSARVAEEGVDKSRPPSSRSPSWRGRGDARSPHLRKDALERRGRSAQEESVVAR
jgi:hypothetical protein